MSTAAPPAVVRHDVREAVALDRRVDTAEGEGLRARWEFGRWLLSRRVGKQLPSGLLDELVAETRKSREELQCRVRFAERYPSDEEVCNAVTHFGSWHRIVNEGLSPELPASAEEEPPEPPHVGPRVLAQQSQLVRGIAERARLIEELTPHLNLDAVPSLPEEEREQWKLQLSTARTALSRLIAAL